MQIFRTCHAATTYRRNSHLAISKRQRIAATYLALPNGLRGDLKKGLTLSVRFLVARRSMLQILYQDVSAWLNPDDNRSAQP